jgi:hypothetical protein
MDSDFVTFLRILKHWPSILICLGVAICVVVYFVIRK